MSVSRRQFILSTSCCLCTCTASSSKADQNVFRGCLISPAGYKEFRSVNNGLYNSNESLFQRNRHFRTTGDRLIDADLDRALGTIADLFEVNPAFGFFDPQQFRGSEGFESNTMNAFASDENTDIPGTEGTIAFGWDLFQREFYQFDNTGMTIMTIAAHEFGHVMQHKRGVMAVLQTGFPTKCELNADFLAGYFLGLKKKENGKLRFLKAAELFDRIGSYGPNRTHGTPQERLDAAEAGFRVAYVEKKSLDDAFRAGLEYVSA